MSCFRGASEVRRGETSSEGRQVKRDNEAFILNSPDIKLFSLFIIYIPLKGNIVLNIAKPPSKLLHHLYSLPQARPQERKAQGQRLLRKTHVVKRHRFFRTKSPPLSPL